MFWAGNAKNPEYCAGVLVFCTSGLRKLSSSSGMPPTIGKAQKGRDAWVGKGIKTRNSNARQPFQMLSFPLAVQVAVLTVYCYNLQNSKKSVIGTLFLSPNLQFYLAPVPFSAVSKYPVTAVFQHHACSYVVVKCARRARHGPAQRSF